MLAQHMYSREEIRQLMDCADVNKDGKLDYMEFTERFYMPAEDIGKGRRVGRAATNRRRCTFA